MGRALGGTNLGEQSYASGISSEVFGAAELRVLGDGINRMNLGEQIYAGGIFSKVFGAAKLRVLWLQRIPCFRHWVVTLTHSLLLIKRILIRNVC